MDNTQKPYLIRAIYEWCIDNALTPYLAVRVNNNTVVPQAYVVEQQIVLNIDSDAVKNLLIKNDLITAQATFGGIQHNLVIPVINVLAIFAKENNQGLQFNVTDIDDLVPQKESKSSGSGIQLIK